tara:strand:- start:914 stop:1447 length:534 start_codon:yes stop_codon:yes gene_type:complete
MYKDYQIRSIDTTEKMVVFKFVEDGLRDYITRRYYEGDISEAKIVNMAKDAQIEAAIFYNRETTSVGFTPESWTGTLKDIIVNDYPDYDPVSQTLNETWEETETTRTQVFTVVDLSDEELAANVRSKRDELLKECDSYALTDRSLTDAFTTYRQALRDITNQEGFPSVISWPVTPVE